ncbi:MAG TPA: CDP-archaeol synthase [Gammaproteobacteria bacterium]
MDIESAARALLLVCLASSTAWAASFVLGRHFAAPLDFGLELPDGKRLFGSHKTWRGFAAGMFACALAAPFVGLEVVTGAAFGAAALAGDALSSAIKRRLALEPGSEVPGLDQLPEALVPLVLLAEPLELGIVEITVVALAFVALDLLATPLRHGK